MSDNAETKAGEDLPRFRTLHHAVLHYRRAEGLTATEVHVLLDRGRIAIGPPSIDLAHTVEWDEHGRAVSTRRPDALEPGKPARPIKKAKDRRE